MNKSGLHPVGCAVLVEPYEPEIKGSTLIIPQHVLTNTRTVETRAVVVEVGDNAWADEPQRAAVGDKVLISKFSGVMAVGIKDGRQYRLVNDRDIFCRLED